MHQKHFSLAALFATGLATLAVLTIIYSTGVDAAGTGSQGRIPSAAQLDATTKGLGARITALENENKLIKEKLNALEDSIKLLTPANETDEQGS